MTRLELKRERNAGRGLEAKCPACTGARVPGSAGAAFIPGPWEGLGAVCTNRLEGGRVCGNYRFTTTKGLERVEHRSPSLLEQLAQAESATHLAALWSELEVLRASPRTRRRWVVARDVRLAQLRAGDHGAPL